MTDSDYTPISCSIHDRLEDLAVRRERVRIRFRDDTGVERHVEGTIVDVWSEGGAEYLRTADGTTIRLDRLREIAGGRTRISA